MTTCTSIEPRFNEIHSFQVTWESTIKCNLDCSYCSPAEHNNAVPHPSLEDCLKTVDFLLEYVDLYIMQRPPEHRYVGFNVFGGESLFHPNIVEILEYIREKHEPYKGRWHLNVQVVTNAIVKPKIWNRIVDLVDYFTVSYHSEATDEQINLFKSNVLDLKARNKVYHCAVLMHPRRWQQCTDMVQWCKDNDIKHLPRQLDHSWHDFKFYYSKDQAEWLHGDKPKEEKSTVKKITESVISFVNMESQGRECCGGIPMHVNGDYSCTQTYIPNNRFKGWSCSVNRFFVFVKQVTGEVFVNKDCRMNFDGKVGPIGYLKDSDKILSDLRTQLETNTLPVIVCKKSKCWCGLCAPKAATREEYDKIIQKHVQV